MNSALESSAPCEAWRRRFQLTPCWRSRRDAISRPRRSRATPGVFGGATILVIITILRAVYLVALVNPAQSNAIEASTIVIGYVGGIAILVGVLRAFRWYYHNDA